MKQKVSDYIADRLAQEGICQVFTVTGGGAMHLNDSLGHHPGLSCLYHHHEQAAAMAAEWRVRYESAASIFVPTLLFRSQPTQRNVQQSSSQPYA